MVLENSNRSSRREQFMLYAPLFIWIGVIFFLSSGQGSMARTSLIVRPILEFLFPSAPEETLLLYHGVIRKFAHFSEYAVLGFLACRALAASAQKVIRNYFPVAAIALVLVVAGADEFNQSFNPQRTGSAVDALIDLSGGLVAVIVHLLVKGRPGQSAPKSEF